MSVSVWGGNQLTAAEELRDGSAQSQGPNTGEHFSVREEGEPGSLGSLAGPPWAILKVSGCCPRGRFRFCSSEELLLSRSDGT